MKLCYNNILAPVFPCMVWPWQGGRWQPDRRTHPFQAWSHPFGGPVARDHFYLAKSVLNSTILPCLLGGGSLYPALTSDNGEARFNKI